MIRVSLRLRLRQLELSARLQCGAPAQDEVEVLKRVRAQELPIPVHLKHRREAPVQAAEGNVHGSDPDGMGSSLPRWVEALSSPHGVGDGGGLTPLRERLALDHGHRPLLRTRHALAPHGMVPGHDEQRQRQAATGQHALHAEMATHGGGEHPPYHGLHLRFVMDADDDAQFSNRAEHLAHQRQNLRLGLELPQVLDVSGPYHAWLSSFKVFV
mmetsp:Transcript_20318/g.39290  ORF Transcript_20318/g.39290 Transcript_20318/m.39290 type:complete len:213 (+) Transcript_20318:391-1029(+)